MTGCRGCGKPQCGLPRLQGRVPAVCRQCPSIARTRGKFQHVIGNYVLATAETVFLLHVIARSAATGQSASPAGKPDKLAAVWVNSLDIAYSPKVLLAVMLRCKENGLPRRFAPRNDMQKLVRCQRLQERPARANPQPVMYSPKVLLIVLCYCGDADCRTSSPQSPPCPAPAKGQSRATLPWVSFPHKAYRFAGPRGYAGRRPAGEQRSLGAPLPAKGAPLRGPQHWFAMTC